MKWPYPRIFAHRGGGKLAPENTLAAIRFGASLGFQGVEFDVMLAGDGTPVLIHDETLDRTTDSSGSVARLSYAQLSLVEAGAWKGKKWQGERIPRFEDAARLCRELGLAANVELKPARGYERRTGEAVAQAARELWHGATPPPLLSSFSTVALAAARTVVPELPRGLLVGRVPEHWRELMQDLECVALHCNYRALSKRLAEQVRAAGYAIVTWTVNDRRTVRRVLGFGVDTVVTDALKRIGPAFK